MAHDSFGVALADALQLKLGGSQDSTKDCVDTAIAGLMLSPTECPGQMACPNVME